MIFIYYSCSGGLCDRIFGLATVWCLAKHYKTQFYIRENKPILSSIFNIKQDVFNIPHFRNIRYCSDVGQIKNAIGSPVIEVIGYIKHHILYKEKMVNDIPIGDVIKVMTDELFTLKNQNFEYLKNMFHQGNYLGVHIRSFNIADDEPPIISQECIDRFIAAINSLDYQNVFICSDNQTVITYIASKCTKKIIHLDGNICHVDKTKNISSAEYDKVGLELFLLGECKEAIISPWSGFSRLGVLRTKIPFYVVNHNDMHYSYGWLCSNPEGFKKGEYSEII
jgi:hypothetical protein